MAESRRTSRLAAPPDAPFTFEMLRRAGGSRWQLERWVEDGLVTRLFNSVYVSTSAASVFDVRLRAVALVLPEHGVVVDRTAAWLWGIDSFSSDELGGTPDLEVFVLRGKKRIKRSHARGGERDLAPKDVVTVGGVRVTTPLRTALDLACRLWRSDALACLDAFMRHHRLTRRELTEELRRYRGRRGVVQARALVELADPRSESPGESLTRLAIHDAGLPPPVPQLWVTDLEGCRWRLDLAYEVQRVAVEYDGERFHSTASQRAADKRRRAALARAGWTVIVVDRTSFASHALFPWLSRLRAALEMAGAAHTDRRTGPTEQEHLNFRRLAR